MKKATEFGIIVACCQQDYLFTKGCCTSIRYFLGEVPICLIVDGKVDTKDLEEEYRVHIINKNTIENKFLQQYSFGWGVTKMIAFFESPWETFLYLDSDTNVWGDVLQYANFNDYDAIIDKPSKTHNYEQINEFFFDTNLVEKQFPNFPWKKYQDYYFCTGTFFARRNIFSIDEYCEMLEFVRHNPGVFHYGEMGFLNFMLCRAAHEQRIRLLQVDLQVICADFTIRELEDRFPVKSRQILTASSPSAVIHWPGKKPFLKSCRTHSKPMDFHRLSFARRRSTINKKDNWFEIQLKIEDLITLAIIYKNKITRKIFNYFKKIKIRENFDRKNK